MSGQRSWLRKLPREDSSRLRPFWYACCCNFGTIPGTPLIHLELHLAGQTPVQRSWLRMLPREDGHRLRPIGTRADVISGRYPVPCPLTLNFTLKVKCQAKVHRCVSYPGRPAVA